MLIITLSFDDGFKTDVKLADILEQYRAKATFFITAGGINRSSAWLSNEDVRWISEIHEVGSHSLNHFNLTKLPEKMLIRELKDSKLLLEKVTGKEVVGFAYPYGASNKLVKRCVRRVGYRYARSTSSYWIGRPKDIKDLYSLNVTLPLYPVKFIGSVYDIVNKLRRIFLRMYLNLFKSGIKNFVLKMVKRDYLDSIGLAKAIISMVFELSKIRKEIYVISLWGHSWEIMLNKDLRSRFEDLLAFIASLSSHVKVMTLRELIENHLVGANR